MHAGVLRALEVVVGIVADEGHPCGAETEAFEGAAEDLWIRFGSPRFAGKHHELEGLPEAQPVEDTGKTVVEVRKHGGAAPGAAKRRERFLGTLTLAPGIGPAEGGEEVVEERVEVGNASPAKRVVEGATHELPPPVALTPLSRRTGPIGKGHRIHRGKHRSKRALETIAVCLHPVVRRDCLVGRAHRPPRRDQGADGVEEHSLDPGRHA